MLRGLFTRLVESMVDDTKPVVGARQLTVGDRILASKGHLEPDLVEVLSIDFYGIPRMIELTDGTAVERVPELPEPVIVVKRLVDVENGIGDVSIIVESDILGVI